MAVKRSRPQKSVWHSFVENRSVGRFLKPKQSVRQAAFMLGLFYFISAVLGVIRDPLLTSRFSSASGILDTYYLVFKIPDLAFMVVVLGAVSAAFIPLFIDHVSKNEMSEAWQMANTMLNILLGFLFILLVLGFIFAEPLMRIVAHGFVGRSITLGTETVSKFDLTVQLFRLILVSPLLFTVSSIAGSIQNAFKTFVTYAIAPILYNLGIIFGILVLSKWFSIYGVIYGVLLGAFVQMALQLLSAVSLGFRWKPRIVLSRDIKGMFRLMAPRSLALLIEELKQIYLAILATPLPNAITFFSLAGNLNRFPVTLFGISLATAIFPTLAERISRTEQKEFRHDLRRTITQILFFVIPIALLMILLRQEIIAFLFRGGEFAGDPNNTRITASVLGLFALSLPAQALIPLTTRAYYAVKDTTTPFLVSIITFIVLIAGAIYFFGILGTPGLSLAFSISVILDVLFLLLFLEKRIPGVFDTSLLSFLTKAATANAALFGVAWLFKLSTGIAADLPRLAILTKLVMIGLPAAAVYILFSLALRMPEAAYAKTLFRKFVRHG